MSLTLNEARDIILKVFKDAWDTTGFPAVYDDTAQPPSIHGNTPSAVTWARATIRHAEGFQSTFIAPINNVARYTNIGTVIIQVFGKLGDGSTAAYDAAQLVATAYRKSSDSLVWFRRVRVNEIGTRGAHTQINVLADFVYDDVR